MLLCQEELEEMKGNILEDKQPGSVGKHHAFVHSYLYVTLGFYQNQKFSVLPRKLAAVFRAFYLIHGVKQATQVYIYIKNHDLHPFTHPYCVQYNFLLSCSTEAEKGSPVLWERSSSSFLQLDDLYSPPASSHNYDFAQKSTNTIY